MKTIKEKVSLGSVCFGDVEWEYVEPMHPHIHGNPYDMLVKSGWYEYKIKSREILDFEKVFIEVEKEVPDTIKEILKENNLTKKELIEWINSNYK